MKTIYMDISNYLGFPHLTGIQRVVSQIAMRLIVGQEEGDYRLVLLRHNRDFSFSICQNRPFMSYLLLSQGKKTDCVTPETVTVDQLEPGSFWLDVDGVWASLIPRNLLYPQLAKRNIQIGVYVHDVIALTHPHLVSVDSNIRFPAYLGAVFDYADYIFTQTEVTKHEIQKLMGEIGCGRPIRFQIAAPGSDFARQTVRDDQVSEEIRRIARRGKVLLTVSTIEIRKNHKVLLDAFDAGLCQMGYQMVFVGKTGWKVDGLMERIRRHPENGKSLFHLQGIDDAALHYLYNHASFVLFPSYTEGYGLATVEAMQCGIPTILSDVPIMREVGGEYCDYFEPDSPQELIGIIQAYEKDPERYARKKESLQAYRAPTWDACARAILDGILSFRLPPEGEHKLEQIVYLSARPDALLSTLRFVEEWMPFIKCALIFCPEEAAGRLKREYSGRLALSCVTDDELLQGRALPDDHLQRNFFLRSLAMRRPELEEEFIMSDDDYRPLKRIDRSFYIKDGRYQAYYFYELDLWKRNVMVPTSFDLAMFRTNDFLKAHGYPDLQYASHMPQVIRKSWYLEMLEEHPELELSGCCEWTTYFNYIVKKHPEAVDVRPYQALAWPERMSSWDPLVLPPDYTFENYYDFLYQDPERPFFGMEQEYHPDMLFENAKKKLLFDKAVRRSVTVRRQWRSFENKCNTTFMQFPSFVFCYGQGLKPAFLAPPPYLEMLNGSDYSIPVQLVKRDESGQWVAPDRRIRIGFRWAREERIRSTENMDGSREVYLRLGSPGQTAETFLQLYYAFDDDDFTSLCEMPVKLKR